ncbi:hypothetical protein CPB84DRAFT_1751361 [Gymnopilus junonius]|uniref:Uncharacterized protein n=1 Tax=Gymnopilus junonius TaxID=109634 RepID=A0A9P5NDP9_GYMJU|nr:hypothetical protein CPB84DRAFT_1751361 [Gymnopilus junonius]
MRRQRARGWETSWSGEGEWEGEGKRAASEGGSHIHHIVLFLDRDRWLPSISNNLVEPISMMPGMASSDVAAIVSTLSNPLQASGPELSHHIALAMKFEHAFSSNSANLNPPAISFSNSNAMNLLLGPQSTLTQSYGDDGPFPLPGDSANSSLLTANALHYASLAPHVIPPTHLPMISSWSWSSLSVNASTSISQNLACNKFLNSFTNDNLFGTEDHDPSGFPNNASHLQSFNSLLLNASIPDQTVQVAPLLDINSLYPPSTVPSPFTNPFHLDSPSMPWWPVTSAGPWSTHSPMEAISSAHPAEASGSPSQEQGHRGSSEELMNWMNDDAPPGHNGGGDGGSGGSGDGGGGNGGGGAGGGGWGWGGLGRGWGGLGGGGRGGGRGGGGGGGGSGPWLPPRDHCGISHGGKALQNCQSQQCAEDWGQDHAPNDAAINQLLNPVKQPGPLVRSQDEEAEENASGNPSDAPPGNSHPRQCRSPLTYSAASSIPQAEEPPPSMPLRHSAQKKGGIIGLPEDVLRLLSAQASAHDIMPFFNGINNAPKMLHFANACAAVDQSEVLLQLVYYLNMMKFACLVQRYMDSHPGYTMSHVWDELEPLTKLQRPIFSTLMVQQLESWLDLFAFPPALFIPSLGSPLGNMVKKILIPKIAYLHRNFGLFNDFIKARDWNSWGECVLDIALPSHSLNLLNTAMFTPIDFSATATAASLETFRVNFKADRVYNTKIQYPRDPVGRFNEMKLQRSLASHAAWALDLEDFKRKFHKQLTSGQCPNLQTYLGLNTTHLEGDELLTMVLPNMPESILEQSQEAKVNDEIYKMLSDVFEPVFKWIHDLLRELLPDAFKELSIFVDMLPNCGISPVYPFGGYVLNINVSTRIHRDMGDKDICLVLVISSDNCRGGKLVLMEPGLVLKLRNGDMVIFPSRNIIHFNLHFCRKRVSLVFHTDKCSKGWVVDANGCKDTKTFHWSRDGHHDEESDVDSEED